MTYNEASTIVKGNGNKNNNKETIQFLSSVETQRKTSNCDLTSELCGIRMKSISTKSIWRHCNLKTSLYSHMLAVVVLFLNVSTFQCCQLYDLDTTFDIISPRVHVLSLETRLGNTGSHSLRLLIQQFVFDHFEGDVSSSGKSKGESTDEGVSIESSSLETLLMRCRFVFGVLPLVDLLTPEVEG
uniref:Uncharacterized protein n=1 Tax=Timema tahoe TaxID=61484 RepID=A0A7R9ISW7_9NEOP|nr:unnamed protein product [Timema tahoe]